MSAVGPVPPHDELAEKSLLGALLFSGSDPAENAFAAAAGQLSATAFYITRHQLIFTAMESIHARGSRVDEVTILDELRRTGNLDAAGGEAYLAHLAATVPSPAGWEDYRDIVLRKSSRRRTIELARSIEAEAARDENSTRVADLTAELAEAIRGAQPRSRSSVQFMGIEELAEEGGEEIPWLVPGLIALEALTLLVSKPKMGKSTFVFAMMAALEQAGMFIGRQCQSTPAVYLSEESAPTILQKARRFGVSNVRIVPRSKAFPPRPFEHWIDAAIEEADEHGARLIIIDTMTMWAGLPPDAEKDSGAIQQAANIALRATARGLAVLLLHHSRKAPGSDIDTVRGSNALPAAGDFIVTIERAKGEDRNRRVLRVFGRDDSLPPEVIVRLSGNGYEALGEAQDVQAEDLLEQVLEELPDAPAEGLTKEEIAAELGIGTGKLRPLLKSLVAEKRADRTGRGVRGSPVRYRRGRGDSEFQSDPSDLTDGMESGTSTDSAPRVDARARLSSAESRARGDGVHSDSDLTLGVEQESESRTPPLGTGANGLREDQQTRDSQ